MSRKRARSGSSRSLAPLLLIGAGAILIVGVLIWQALRVNNQAVTPTSNPAGQQNLPFPEVSRVSVQDSKQAFDEEAAVFLDVRDAGSYSQGHIPGALNIPVDEVEQRAGELDSNQRIIIYCT